MKLLISTYACAPGRGSEHAVGWNWVTEAHRLGHQVWAFASSAHRAAIETACRDDPGLCGIHWTFPGVEFWPLRPATEPTWERTYNLLWQRAALGHARELHRTVIFDAIHHLTWGGVRAPTFLGSLGAPLIMGPFGGGETSPTTLRDGFGLKARLTERIRDLSNATITLDPTVRGGLDAASVIFVKTPDTRRLLTSAMRAKTVTFLELGLNEAQISTPRRNRAMQPRLLFAGRLLYWKGVHIAIRALEILLERMPDARLTIVGDGPEEKRLKTAARHLAGKVEFISRVPQTKLFELYASHNLLIYPSLHDSSGNVVMEALSSGMPVLCLGLGGPRDIVTPASGIVVRTARLNTAGVAAAMADEIVRMFADPSRLAALSAGAIARASEFLLSDRVAQLYEIVANRIDLSNDNKGGPIRERAAQSLHDRVGAES